MAGTISLTSLGTAYTQDFDTLSNTAGATTVDLTINGWYMTESGGGARDNEQYAVGTGSSNTGDTYSFGAAGATDRALGAVRSGTLIPVFGASFTNDTGSTIASLSINYIGEQWRLGTISRTDQLNFEYSLDATSLTTGTWTGVSALNFVTPFTTTVGATDGNAPANQASLSTTLASLSIASGATFWIRYIDTDASGGDDGLAVDNFSLTANGAGPATTVSINDVSIAEGDGGTQLLTFTVTRSGNAEAFTVDFEAVDDTATSGSQDYDSASGTISFTAGGSLTETISITINGDTTIEQNETFLVNLFNLVGPANVTISDSQGVGTIINDDVTRIYEIQGASHTSSMAGTNVLTVGIVTAVASNGFYLQDETGDGNLATSDGIFVFTSSAPTVAVGDSLRVSGTVTEFQAGGATSGNLTLTELTSPVVTVLSTGNTLPIATLLGDGFRVPPTGVIEDDAFGSFDHTTDAIDFFESLEGMLVGLNGAVSVSATSSFEEIWVTTTADPASGNARGGVTINVGDFNPQIIQIDDLVSGVVMPSVDVGATFGNMTGVVGYSFGNYEVLVGTAPTVVTPSPLEREETFITATPTQLTFASFNAENLDGLDLQAKFDQLAAQIVTNLGAPTIIALQEIQDNNGAVGGTGDPETDASLTAQRLIDAITAAGGPAYTYVDVAPSPPHSSGGEPGGNIRPGFLYRADVVGLVPGSVTTLDVPAFAGSRDPLVVQFTFNGETITFINNHFSSKGGDDPLFGDTQPPVLGSEVARTAQAQVVNDYVDTLLTADPNANIVVLGDLNDFSWSTPLRTLDGTAGGGARVLWELGEQTLADPAERYSYVFNGNSQVLDHMYASQGVLDMLARFDIVHSNAEFAVQASDHDPSVASLVLNNPATPGNDSLAGNASANTIGGGDGNDIVWGFGGDDVLNGGAGNDKLKGGADDDFIFGGSGDDIIEGGAGTNELRGLAGNDVYYVGDLSTPSAGPSGDSIIEGAGEGFDYAYIFAGGFTLTEGSEVEVVYARLTSDTTLAGNELANRLIGNAGNDTLDGGAGNDVLEGRLGNDNLFGGAGNDKLYGDAGDDVLRGGLGIDQISFGTGNDTLRYEAADFLNGEWDNVYGFTDAGGGDSDILRLQGTAGDYLFTDGAGFVRVFYLPSGAAPGTVANVYIWGMTSADLADQIVYFP